MGSLAGTVIIASLIAHALLLIYVQAQRQRVRTGRLWLTLAVLFSFVAAVIISLAPDVGTYDGFLVILALAAVITTYGALVIRDVTNHLPRLWLLAGLIWIAALLAGAFLSDPQALGQPDWLINSFSAPTILTLITLIGLLILGVILLGLEFYAFYAAALPEVANRALFWVIDATILITGIILIISGTDVLTLIGQPVILIGIGGAIYAQVSYRVIDIRRELNSALRTLILLLITALVIYGALSAANLLDDHSALPFAALALIAALIYVPLRLVAESAINLLLRRSFTSPTEATRRYSQQISAPVELPALVEAATRTLNSLMRVRRSALILVNDTGSSEINVELQMLPSDLKPSYLSKSGLLYRQFANDGACISQFDLEFNPDYKAVPEGENRFFRDTQMSAYAPIVFENELIGILACGPKTNDAPFTVRDFELLATMAHQTGTALRNARLVADLRNLNEGMKSLNSSLEGAKDQMERLELGQNRLHHHRQPRITHAAGADSRLHRHHRRA